jgi:hypothetical protein
MVTARLQDPHRARHFSHRRLQIGQPARPLRLQNLGCARESLPLARQVHGMDRVQCDLGLRTIQPALARVEQARQVVWGIMTSWQ